MNHESSQTKLPPKQQALRSSISHHQTGSWVVHRPFGGIGSDVSPRPWPSTSPDLVGEGRMKKRPCLRRQDVKFQTEAFKDVETKVINHLAPSDIHEWSWMHLILYVRIWLFVDPSGPELPLPIAHWVRRLDSFQWTLVLSHHPDVFFRIYL